MDELNKNVIVIHPMVQGLFLRLIRLILKRLMTSFYLVWCRLVVKQRMTGVARILSGE